MDPTLLGSLSTQAPLAVVAPPGPALDLLVDQLLRPHSYGETALESIFYCHEANIGANARWMVTMMTHYRNIHTLTHLPTRQELDTWHPTRRGQGLLVLVNVLPHIQASPDLMDLYLNRCIPDYHLTPLFITTSMHMTGFTSGHRVLDHCGHVFVLPPRADSVHEFINNVMELAVSLYPDPTTSHWLNAQRLTDLAREMTPEGGKTSGHVDDLPDDHREGQGPGLFIHRMHPDGRLRIIKRVSCPQQPDYYCQIPALLDKVQPSSRGPRFTYTPAGSEDDPMDKVVQNQWQRNERLMKLLTSLAHHCMEMATLSPQEVQEALNTLFTRSPLLVHAIEQALDLPPESDAPSPPHAHLETVV